ncbi:hypothetical protein [Yoonia sp. R2-816]|uniref:hypothetical protein n=1 Tax=Yoonia sp. R2-816 TaxID=3342638 RepID=UPI00372A5BE1
MSVSDQEMAAQGRHDGQTVSDHALQTDLQGKAGTMLKSADETHVQHCPPVVGV